MAKNKKRKPKHVPQRTCVGCQVVASKRSMIRIVRTPQGIIVDPGGKLPGRGAYLHKSRACWEAGIKSGISRSLKTQLSSEDHDHLANYMARLPIVNESK